jgi:hypothetical protein
VIRVKINFVNETDLDVKEYKVRAFHCLIFVVFKEDSDENHIISFWDKTRSDQNGSFGKGV